MKRTSHALRQRMRKLLFWIVVASSSVVDAFSLESRLPAPKAGSFHHRTGMPMLMRTITTSNNNENYYYKLSRKHFAGGLCCAMSTESFDFSAPSKWDDFYKQNEDCYEWHSSIPLERIATNFIPEDSHCLMVGCGNSQLPQAVLDAHPDRPPRLVLLDTSETCLDQLRQVYGSSVDYVCGDATRLSTLLHHDVADLKKAEEEGDDSSNAHDFETSAEQRSSATPPKFFDIIVDKGLTDAILCGEGWNGPLEQLFQGASRVLNPSTNNSGGGKYLLISYRLPSSTKEFLKEVGASVGLEWEFDLSPDSNTRVGISIATKIN